MSIKKYKKAIFLIPLILTSNLYANSITDITTAVKGLCKAPTAEKSNYYKVSVTGESTLRVKIIGLLGGSTTFDSEEWNGIQRVLREHQAGDNDSYRRCSAELTPLFIEKFQLSVETNKEQEETKKNQISIIGNDNEIGKIKSGDTIIKANTVNVGGGIM